MRIHDTRTLPVGRKGRKVDGERGHLKAQGYIWCHMTRSILLAAFLFCCASVRRRIVLMGTIRCGMIERTVREDGTLSEATVKRACGM